MTGRYKLLLYVFLKDYIDILYNGRFQIMFANVFLYSNQYNRTGGINTKIHFNFQKGTSD